MSYDKARLVIVGSGIVGASAAYHLTKMGWRDIMVLDQGHPHQNAGSTSHAPGGVVPLSHSMQMTRFAAYSSKLFSQLTPYREDMHTFHPVGQMEIAISQERWVDLKRLHGEAKSFGMEAHLLSPSEMKAMVPTFNEDALVGCVYTPEGAMVAAWHVSAALARDAMATGGAEFIGNTEVTKLDVKNGKITGVSTNNPEMPYIACEQVLLCTNIWGPVLTEEYGIRLPFMGYEHQYVITKPLEGLSEYDPTNKDDETTYPIMRELDSAMYYRKHWDQIGIGSYQHAPLTVAPREVGATAMRDFTPEHFAEPWKQAQHVMPILKTADPEFHHAFNGIFAFPVDGYPMLGETTINGLWTAIGSWITHSGGVGKTIAEWMTEGDTEWDMRQCDVNRFADYQTTPTFVRAICDKNYREIYDIIHPKNELSAPRNVRLSPFHPRLEALDAHLIAAAGIESPNWFESNARLLEKYEDQIPDRSGWGAMFWSRIQGAEHLETRNNAALFDLTGLSIIEVRGSGALSYVNQLCSNDVAKPIGKVVYTLWLTPKGGVKRDLAVVRLAEDQIWMFVGEGSLPQDLDWVKRNAPKDGSVTINDVSNSYSALGLWGPNARKILEKVTPNDVSNEAFPYFTAQWIDIAGAFVLALRVSYAGELGWELHIPMDQSLPVWDAVWEAGREFDMIPAGMGAFDSLRLEKGYRLWGGDVYTEYDPYQSGLGWTVRLKKDDFIGKNACVELKEKPLKKKLCCLTLDDPEATLFGYEPIMNNGDCVGHITTANYGYSVGKYIAYGYLPKDYTQPGTELDVIYLTGRYKAVVTDEPLYDKEMARLKA